MVSDHDDSVGAAIVEVVEDAKSYAAAQVTLYRATLAARARAARTGIILGVSAAVLALSALIALLVGLMLALATLVGPLWATVMVVLAVVVVAGILGRLAASRLSDAMGPIE